MSAWRWITRSRLYQGWMAIAGHFGGVQTRVLLAFFYVLLVGPVSSLARLGGRDYLDKKPLDPSRTAWHDADTSPPDLERAKLQT
jgi:hypothetical protein